MSSSFVIFARQLGRIWVWRSPEGEPELTREILVYSGYLAADGN
jgi:hypothetical protein